METVKEKTETVTIKVCMGSACFARGNAYNLDFIENYVKNHNIDADVQIYGSGCERKCASGPNVIINGELFESVSPVRLESILETYL